MNKRQIKKRVKRAKITKEWRQYLTVAYSTHDQDQEHPVMFIDGNRMDERVQRWRLRAHHK